MVGGRAGASHFYTIGKEPKTVLLCKQWQGEEGTPLASPSRWMLEGQGIQQTKVLGGRGGSHT